MREVEAGVRGVAVDRSELVALAPRAREFDADDGAGHRVLHLG